MEWCCWPGFLSQTYFTILLAFLPITYGLGGTLLANVLWTAIRYRAVSVAMADLGCLFVRFLKLPVAILMGSYFIWHGDHLKAIVCALWIPFSGFVPLVVVFPGEAGRVQMLFLAKLGYRPVESS
jgi:hypothetical protein